LSVSLDRLLPLLQSPRSSTPLVRRGARLCTADDSESYPILGEIPILIDEATSAFSIGAFVEAYRRPPAKVSAMEALAQRLLPSVSRNIAARDNYRRLAETLAARPDRVRVLVIGGSIAGVGFEELFRDGRFELIETDVAFGPRTDVVCDGHDLPFKDGSFDAVVCQAVLEHVADPPRVVDEVWRVLVPDGLVYSEIPFMQQVHEGVFDFTRYTLVGHRRLYRRFEVLALGPTGGPGMSLAWSIVYFFAAAGSVSPRLRDVFVALARLLTFWLKYLDRPLLRLPRGVDAASGTFFFGRKSESTLSDHDLVQFFGGGESGYAIYRA
jgi:SAM-dependent methyltransferase